MVRAIVDMISHARVVVREDGAQVKSGQQMQGERLNGRNAGVDRLVLPLLIIIEAVVGITAIAVGPVGTCGIIGRPIEPPQQVACLHEIVGTRRTGVVIAAL